MKLGYAALTPIAGDFLRWNATPKLRTEWGFKTSPADSFRFGTFLEVLLSAYACRLGVKRRAVARYLSGVVVNRDLETFVSVTPRLGLENQIVANDTKGFQIGRAASAFPLLLKPALFLGGIGAGGGPILSLGHGASKRIRFD
jgi:hypothetical protein